VGFIFLVGVRSGKGVVTVNGKKLEEVFPLAFFQDKILSPFQVIGDCKEFDINIRVRGGGKEGQVSAIRLGLAKVLAEKFENKKESLKKGGFLKRDVRRKERKKYGLAGARKRFQFSKR